MSSAMTGALVGAAFGLIGFALLRQAAYNAEHTGGRTHHARRTASILRAVAFADLMLLPTIGYYVGPMVLDAV